MGNASEKCRIVDLVSVEVQDGEDRAVANGVEELVDMPRSRQWAGFRFAISDHRGDNQVRIVKSSTASVRENVAQFAALVDRTRCFWRAMTADSAGKRKLFEEFAQAFFVFTLFRINLRVCA